MLAPMAFIFGFSHSPAGKFLLTALPPARPEPTGRSGNMAAGGSASAGKEGHTMSAAIKVYCSSSNRDVRYSSVHRGPKNSPRLLTNIFNTTRHFRLSCKTCTHMQQSGLAIYNACSRRGAENAEINTCFVELISNCRSGFSHEFIAF